MRTETHGQPPGPLDEVELGIAGWRVPLHAHLACFWETEVQFAAAVGFVEAGLRGSDDACVVVGSAADDERVVSVLASRGLDVEELARDGRLAILERGLSAAAMERDVLAAFAAAQATGAAVIRLLGNVGWDRGREAPDAELFAFEARLGEIAERWPCVVLCLHEVPALTGPIVRHGVLATHPLALEAAGVLANPCFVPLGSPEQVAAIGAELARRQHERQALGQRSELLQSVFDHIPVMISLFDAAGRLLLANREWERALGWSAQEARRIDVLAEIYPDPQVRRRVLEFMRKAENRWESFTMRTRHGGALEASWARVALLDGTSIGFGQDVTARQRTEERLRRSHDELLALSARLRTAREEESARIAREVHDQVGQTLTALRLDVAWLLAKLAGAPPAARGELAAKLHSMTGLLDSASDAVHRIASELRPGVLDQLGLEAAVEWYVGEFEQRTGISCRLRASLAGAPLDPDHATALFRILQEALTNVARHASATTAEIRLVADAREVRLEVADDGRGIAEDELADSRSLGLLGMRERARALGGDVGIRRHPAQGTIVEASLPR